MANVSRINGFKPAKTGLGAPWNGQLTKYYVTAGDTTAIFVGDLVSLNGESDANGIRAVTKTPVGGAAVGAVVQVEYDMADLNTPQYRPASTAKYVYVADDPNTIYEAQISGASPTATMVGQNANHIDSGGSAITGVSGEQVDSTTVGTTSTLTLKILDYVQSPENEVGQYAKVRVKINNHQLAGGTGTLGV